MRGHRLDAAQTLRREINDGLQVVENWNSANGALIYGKDRGNRRKPVPDLTDSPVSGAGRPPPDRSG